MTREQHGRLIVSGVAGRANEKIQPLQERQRRPRRRRPRLARRATRSTVRNMRTQPADVRETRSSNRRRSCSCKLTKDVTGRSAARQVEHGVGREAPLRLTTNPQEAGQYRAPHKRVAPPAAEQRVEVTRRFGNVRRLWARAQIGQPGRRPSAGWRQHAGPVVRSNDAARESRWSARPLARPQPSRRPVFERTLSLRRAAGSVARAWRAR